MTHFLYCFNSYPDIFIWSLLLRFRIHCSINRGEQPWPRCSSQPNAWHGHNRVSPSPNINCLEDFFFYLFILSHPYTRHSLTTLWLATMTFKCKLQTGWTILSGEQHVLHAGLQGVHTEQESTSCFPGFLCDLPDYYTPFSSSGFCRSSAGSPSSWISFIVFLWNCLCIIVITVMLSYMPIC